jgi:tRNA(Ile)-lysidine synthase
MKYFFITTFLFHAIITIVLDLDHLSHILQQDCRLNTTRLVLIGVSGGPDSLSLLDVMHRLGYPLVVAHLNHGLRAEAGEEALVVRESARVRGLGFVLEEADIAGYAREHTLSIEEAARKVRYQFLFEQARKCKAQAIAVAHTADDQIETVLMHMLRGAGLSGLKGMNFHFQPNPWDSEIALVRPLLGIFRDEILSYCSERNLSPVFDRSNLDTTYFRNRIRNELIPLLLTYNAGIKSNLWHMSQILAGDDQVLETYTRIAWRGCCLEQSDQGVALEINNLITQPMGIQQRLIRLAISILRPGLRDIDYAGVGKVLEFIQRAKRNAHWDLADGLSLFREGDALWIANWESELPAGNAPQIPNITINIAIPGFIDLPGGWHIQAERVAVDHDAIDQVVNNPDPNQAWIDNSQDIRELIIRSSQPGDRFLPFGLDGHSVKLSDYFINVKVPRRLRSNWPLICVGDEVVWIPGYRISHPFRLTPSSTRAVYLRLIKEH